MRKLRKYVVRKAFKDYLPERNDFEIVDEVIPALNDGEFLVKAEYISVDPYMRSFADGRDVPYDQFGFQVGKVVDSRNSHYPADIHVVSHSGWRDFSVLTAEPDPMFNVTPYRPHTGSLPISLAIGALGMPGITAYLGLTEICDPKENETVCVTSAGGAVGSLVGQIAKLKGCTVIGFAGSDHKVNMLLNELGFDYAFNYKTTNVKEALNSTGNIDCYFDNVGGELAKIILGNMKEHGRVAICGSISTYGKKSRRKALKAPVSVKMEAFSFTQWDITKQQAAVSQLRDWLESGAIKAKETITNGFEELPDTLLAMLKGENVGKAVVKV
ncbi:prostaglandin reductase 1-like [Manduca sexta]|uniref:15-oxoprostaglandin 13-reductase n=1 Tax=Manduca sexta TaxID=7130 RepID=A0A922CDT8_MANSE|nr:prostaglandin reductase 1-like [Manduca sexta]KAG6442552.1 hypothetical protein O3G_MSEX002420 [Manduca sexta]